MASPIGRNSPSRWETPDDIRRRKEAAERRVKERHRLLAVQTREKHKMIAEERARLTAELKEKETRALKKEQEELNKRMAQFERDKAYKLEVLARQHAMKSRTSANPKVAFGSASPRELSYLDNLPKEQKAYDKKLTPPGQPVLPRTTRTSMGAMTTSLYVSSTPKRPATSRPMAMTRTPQPAKSQLMTQSFYSPARPATTVSRNSTPRRAPSTTTIAKSVPNSAARTTTPARAVPPKATNGKLPPKKPAAPVSKAPLPITAKAEPETPVHEEVHVDMGSTDGERGDSPKPKGDIVPEVAVAEEPVSSDHSKVNVSTNGLSSLLEEPIIVAEHRNETLTADVTPSVVSAAVEVVQEDTNTALIILNDKVVSGGEVVPVVEENQPVAPSLADELSQVLGGEDGYNPVQEVAEAAPEARATVSEEKKEEVGIDLVSELGQVSLEDPPTLADETHNEAAPEVVEIVPQPTVTEVSATADQPQEHLEEPIHADEPTVLPSETVVSDAIQDSVEDAVNGLSPQKPDFDSLELKYQVPEVENESVEVAVEKEKPESIPEQETVASKPPTPPVPKVDEESLIRRKEEDRRHNEDIRARLAAVKAKIGRTSPPNGSNDGEARSASPPAAAVTVAPVAPSNQPPAATISASTAALLQRLQAAGKVKTNGVGNILARHASDPKLDAPEDPISAE